MRVAVGHENVVGLQVAVRDAQPVQVDHSHAELPRDVFGVHLGEGRRVVEQQVEEAAALADLGHQHHPVRQLVRAIEAHRAHVAHHAPQPHLLLEVGVRIHRELRLGHQLERDARRLARALAGAEHHLAEAALAQSGPLVVQPLEKTNPSGEQPVEVRHPGVPGGRRTVLLNVFGNQRPEFVCVQPVRAEESECHP